MKDNLSRISSMKKNSKVKTLFSRFMLCVTTASAGILFSLTFLSIILGPQKVDNALRALTKVENFKRDYKKKLPFFAKYDEIEKSKSEVLGISTDREIIDRTETPPLLVPSSGIAPSSAFLYTGPLSEGKHEGIDIWTFTNGTGMDGLTYGKGNPVYASCSGYVRTVWEENGDVSIICDDLDEFYKDIVPSLKIKTLYGHMADQFSDDVFIYVKEGQRVNRGDLIGHQGNRCYWAPQNSVVHLHFGVYDISNVKQVPLDPTPYIGVSCTTLNQIFIAGE